MLNGRNQPPLVRGQSKRRLKPAQYEVVEVLLNAGAKGLTKDELEKQSKHGDARGILRRLADSDPDWKAVIHFAGITGGGYRIG